MSEARWSAFLSSPPSRMMMVRKDSMKTTMLTEPML